MLQGDTGEKQRDNARHLGAVGEKVAAVGHQQDQARLDAGKATQLRVFQHQGDHHTEENANECRCPKHTQKETNALEDVDHMQLLASKFAQSTTNRSMSDTLSVYICTFLL